MYLRFLFSVSGVALLLFACGDTSFTGNGDDDASVTDASLDDASLQDVVTADAVVGPDGTMFQTDGSTASDAGPPEVDASSGCPVNPCGSPVSVCLKSVCRSGSCDLEPANPGVKCGGGAENVCFFDGGCGAA